MRVRIGKDPAEQHLVGREAHSGNHIRRLERCQFDLGEEVLRVAVQRPGADLDERVVLLRPDLGEVERIEAVLLRLVDRHDLDLERPARELAVLDRLVQILAVIVGITACQRVGLCLREELDALVGLEVVLDPEALTVGIDPLVGVRAESVHVPPRLRNAAIAHQPGDLMRGFGPQRPEVPLHVVIAKSRTGKSLLRTDEVGELDRILDEEDRRVVADQIVVAVLGVELDRESAGIAPGIGATLLARDRRKAYERFGFRARREQLGLGVARHVTRDHEFAERPAALGVHDPLGYALAVELRKLLDQVVVVEQDRTLRSRRQRLVVACDRNPGVRGGAWCHLRISFVVGAVRF